MAVKVRKRGIGWEYRFEGAKIDGKRKQVSKGGFRTKKEAEIAGNEAYNTFNKTGEYIVPSDISFADLLDMWLEHERANYVKTTISGYKKKIANHIKPELGKYKAKALSYCILQDFITKLFNEGTSRYSLSGYMAILSQCFKFAIKENILVMNPMDNVMLPRTTAIPETPSKEKAHVYIEQDEIKKIFNRFPEGSSAHIPLMLGYKCGLRLGEAFGVSWDDIDFDNKQITINRQVQWVDKKTDKNNQGYWYIAPPKYNEVRIIDIDDDLVNLLKRTRALQLERRHNFSNYKNLYISNNDNKINSNNDGKAIEFVSVKYDGSFCGSRIIAYVSQVVHYKLGFKEFDFHSLRHTHCTMLFENDVNLKYIQKRLGHKNLEVTLQYYIRYTEEMHIKGKAIIENMF